MKKLIIDRFEGPFAVCELEDKSFLSLPKYKLPLNCAEGDLLIQDEAGMYQKDAEASKNIEKRIIDRMNRLLD